MRISKLFWKCTGACAVLGCLAARTSAYFVISEPSRDSQWVNGAVHPVSWTKGVQDGISMLDVELARLSQNGLTFVAKNVPAKPGSLNILIQDIPPGDDYFVVFMNSTHGALHATSSRFAILPASSSASGSQQSPISSAPTVTVSGSPNPTQLFATTFPALNSGSLPRWDNAGHAWGLGSVMVGCLVGAAWTLW